MVACGRDPLDAGKDIVYALYASPAGERVLRSVDNGATFTKGALIAVGAYGDAEVKVKRGYRVVSLRVPREEVRR